MQQSDVFNVVGEDYWDIYKANKINWQKGALGKNRKIKKYTSNRLK